MKATIALIAITLAGCAATSKQLELCYARADVRFGEQAVKPDADMERLEAQHWDDYEVCLAEEEKRKQ